MNKYKREEIIRKLERKGLRAKYRKGSGILDHFKALPHVVIGNKCRGYLDYLGVDVIRAKSKWTKQRTNVPSDERGAKAWSFAWFANREDAQSWIADQKTNKNLGFTIERSEIVPVGLEFRACVQGGIGDEGL